MARPGRALPPRSGSDDEGPPARLAHGVPRESRAWLADDQRAPPPLLHCGRGTARVEPARGECAPSCLARDYPARFPYRSPLLTPEPTHPTTASAAAAAVFAFAAAAFR